MALVAARLVGLAGLAGLVVLTGPGCRGREPRPAKVPFATQAAYGRPDTCPDDAVDVYGDGTPGPDDLRCSYSDGTGSMLTRVRGRVQIEGPPGSSGQSEGLRPGESPGRVRVGLHRASRAAGDVMGPEIAHVVTEPQGTFTLGAMLRPGEMMLVVSDPDSGEPLVQQRITVGGAAGHRLDVRIVIPRPLDDDAPPVAEPVPAVEPAPLP